MARVIPWLLLPLAAVAADAGRRSVTLPSAEEGAIDPRTMWGPVARELEEELDSLGYEPGRVDGRIDAATIDALRELQRCNGVAADGRIGRSTASLLHLDTAALFTKRPREETGRVRAGVDPPSLADDPLEEAGTDPLDLSSMPTVGDTEEPLDADDQIRPQSGAEDLDAAIDREECLERGPREPR